MKVTVQPLLLQWARERAGLSERDLAKKLTAKPEQVTRWEEDGEITYKRAEKLARVTQTPFGYLFLEEPPEETLPVTDFRTVGSEGTPRPSPELLDTLYDAMRKQSWYRDYLLDLGEERLDFVGSAGMKDGQAQLAERISERFGFGPAARTETSDWEQALTMMFDQCEDRGVLVLRSGVAEGNPHRPLRVDEFRGFALNDPYAPLIFVNTRDAPAAQMFTLVHELVHLWLGLSGVSNLERTYAPGKKVEQFCNAVAAEVLVPLATLRRKWKELADTPDPIAALRRHFKVSGLVVLRRLRDLRELDADTFTKLYREQEEAFRRKKAAQKGGGNYYATQGVRVGKRFAKALIGSALEGRTPYREAYSLLGVKKAATFRKFADQYKFTS